MSTTVDYTTITSDYVAMLTNWTTTDIPVDNTTWTENSTCTVPSKGNKQDLLGQFGAICKYVLCERKMDTPENVFLYGQCKATLKQFQQRLEFEESVSETVSSESKVVISVLFVAIMMLSVCGNILVVLTFISNKHMRSVTNVFILSLAVSDLMVTFALIPIDIGTTLHPFWVFGRFACKLIPCIDSFSVACSSLTLCCIAFDRYYAIVHPLKLKFLQTPRRAAVLQSFVWVTSISAAIPYAVFFDTVELSACKQFDQFVGNEICIVQRAQKDPHRVFVWVSLLILFVGPFLFMSVMYTIICHKLWIQRPIGAGVRTFDNRLKLKKRAIKMLITVVFIFVVCWSPVLLFDVIAEMHKTPTNMTTRNWRAYLQCLSVSSTCWNPLVYAFMNEKFRSAFRTLITCCKNQAPPIITRNNEIRMSAESKKTTSQLEMPLTLNGSQQTSETKM